MSIEVKLAFDVLAFISVMVLIVLGLGVIASMMGIFNFAHGEFVLLGAYTVYLFESSGLSAWAGIVAAPVVLALVGLVLERLVIRRFYAAPIIAMLGTYAIGLVIREIVRGLLGGHYKSISEPMPGVITVFGVDFSAWRTRDRAHHRLSSSPAPGSSSPAPRSACRSAARSRIPTSRAPAGSRPPGSTPAPSPSARRWPASPAR